MNTVQVVCPMCDGEVEITETQLHIGEPIRCSHCYELSALIHVKVDDGPEKVWRLDYLMDNED